MRTREEALGRVIGGKYRLGEVLAVGGMGVVHAGVHEGTGRAVAVKRLRSEFLTQPDIVRRVSAEARLAVEASHPNVVEVLDAGADEAGVPYLVLERLYGHPLEALLTEPLSLLATAQALVPVANAVAALHRIGIVHRDIKPSNIFLHRDMEGRVTPKLLDFGIAKALVPSVAALTGAALGTPAYMAPEQALGYRAGGAAADVWSMGVVFVRCLTGRLPFEGHAERSVTLRSVLCREQLSGVPESIAALLVRALAFEPGERPADMKAFRDELLEALAAVDACTAWPGDASVSFSPSESVLPSSIEVEACPVRQASPGLCARPRGVDTRTLTNAAAARARRAGRSSPLPALLGAAAIAAAGLALVAAGGRDRHPGEPMLVAERAPLATARRIEAGPPARGGGLETDPSGAISAATAPAAAPPAAAPSVVAPSVLAPSAVAPPAAELHAAAEARGPSPVTAHARASRGSAPPSPDTTSTFRVGANRAPIIE